MTRNRQVTGCFFRMLEYILYGVILFVIAMGIEHADKLTDLIHQDNQFQRKATISLNEYVAQGQELPENEYVSLETRWVIGPYADETTYKSSTYQSEYSIKYGKNKGKVVCVENFYYAMLDDGSIMTIKVRNSEDIAKLDRMSEWLLSVDGFPLDGETIALHGELMQLKDEELLDYYKEYLSIFGLTATDSEVRYLMLDTTEGRSVFYNSFSMGIVIVAVGMIVLIILVKQIAKRKKLKKQKELWEAIYAAKEEAEKREAANG